MFFASINKTENAIQKHSFLLFLLLYRRTYLAFGGLHLPVVFIKKPNALAFGFFCLTEIYSLKNSQNKKNEQDNE